MATAPSAVVTERLKAGQTTFARVARYVAIRTASLFVTVVIGVYLSVLIANMGGYVDQIRKTQIREGAALIALQDPTWYQLSEEERHQRINEIVAIEERRLGLDQPFIVRSFRYLMNAITLNLGRAEQLNSDSGSNLVRLIILERLPSTLYLFATGQLLLFFASIFIALYLSQRYNSWLDRIMAALAPSSAAPGWFYGIFLILIFAAWLRWLPFGGMVATPPPSDTLAYALSLLKHLILPVAAILLSSIFQTVYYWRTFFLIYSREDYVEMARAKGLSSRMIERRYILRPTLPTIVTSFALTLISLWTGAIVLETVFNWPGLGRLLYQAIGAYDTPVIIGSVVIYAYLLAVTVFVLDIVYAILDPRVKVGGNAA